MSEEVLIINGKERQELEILVNICKREFIRDKKVGREPLFNELTLIKCLDILKMESFVLGDYDKKWN